MNSRQAKDRVLYSERMWAPVWWWLIGAAIVISLVVAVGAWSGPVIGGVFAGVVTALVAWALLAAGSVRTVVDEKGLSVGRARIEWRWLDRARGLDAATMNSVMHSSHQVGSYLVTRPWMRSGVVVRLADPADPHPAWIISTRHPDELARVIGEHIGAGSQEGTHD